jgi:hypothetical protein
MGGKIFVNYRRGDDPGFAGRLFDSLTQAFKPEQLFMDVDRILPGQDFVRVLEEQVAQSDVVLTVIGKGWLDARDAIGRRLDNPEDLARIEIALALNQEKHVIPVLVGEAHMPRADELPEAIRLLARRNAVRLTHERFRADTQGLTTALQKKLEEVEAHRRKQEERKRNGEEARQAAKAEGHLADWIYKEHWQARLEAERKRQEVEVKVHARIVHGAPDGWFLPGSGKNQWFQEYEGGRIGGLFGISLCQRRRFALRSRLDSNVNMSLSAHDPKRAWASI